MNLDDYLTPDDAAPAIGAPNRRAVYRALRRAAEAGEDVVVMILGRRMIPKTAVETLKKYYYPYYSEAHQAKVRQWGAAGGAASGVTKRFRKEITQKLVAKEREQAGDPPPPDAP